MSLIGTLTSGVSALRSFTRGLEIIGNNVANVNTTGFKGSKASFSESFSNTLQGSAPSGTLGSNQSAMQIGTGVQLSAVKARFTQGALTTTGVGTDLGVSGNGFFRVNNSLDGTSYATRAGDFRMDDRVQGLTGGDATNPPTTVGDVRLGTPPAGEQLQSFSLDRQGNMIEFYSDGSSATTNRVLLQTYSDPSSLTRVGDNLFSGLATAGPVGGLALSAASNGPGSGGLGTIESGTLELSNVDLTEQFADMITAQRSFQASSRIVTISDSVLEEIVNLKR